MAAAEEVEEEEVAEVEVRLVPEPEARAQPPLGAVVWPIGSA